MDIKNLSSNKGNIIKGVCTLNPRVFEDSRGFFYESWNQEIFNNAVGEEVKFVQDNHSSSDAGVLRGLHYQLEPKAQAKLVRCTKGAVFDVLVDIRQNSDTYGEWSGIVLNEENKLQFWIPEGFVHGFISLKDFSEVQYKTNEYWDKDHERSLLWKDSDLNINWPLVNSNGKYKIIISHKDSIAPTLKEIEKSGDLF